MRAIKDIVIDDEIFLLSTEEYIKYKSNIPLINAWWWLRSPGIRSCNAALVNNGGSVDDRGSSVSSDIFAARPALRITKSANLKIGDRFIKYDFPWIYIGDELAIAEVPIAFRKFDSVSNDYEHSRIRRFLLGWLKERKVKDNSECDGNN